MTDGQSLVTSLHESQKMLRSALSEFHKRSRAYSESRKSYQIALAKQILLLRSEKYPATIIPDLARGNEEVAELRFERDIAEGLMKSAQEAINVYKLEVRLLESQIDREWTRKGD